MPNLLTNTSSNMILAAFALSKFSFSGLAGWVLGCVISCYFLKAQQNGKQVAVGLELQVHPGLFASGVPWQGGDAFKDALAQYSNTALACTYVRDKGSGCVTIDKEGKPRLHYTISPYDQKSIWKVGCLFVHTCACAAAIAQLYLMLLNCCCRGSLQYLC